MNLKNKKRVFNLILVVIWMIFIFYMSSRDGNESTKQSNFVMNILNILGINLSNKFGEFASVIIRKGAHITEYAILCILLFNVLKENFENKNKAILFSIIGVFLYACTDEFHQTFVPGRSGQFTDVLVDTSGAILASLLIKIKYYFKYKNEKELSF
ncbi:VanZ family protein [Clostridium mediterraneense]|uniref:VanZ family protein n=1 Tax=Clostridium mediterraneense TaxID=1805472 RepID=UPI0008321E4B|nr:VanZ family protein [Clostridium mediterraneense]